MREIPSKNYVIFAFVIIISIGIVAYCMRWYQMRTAIDKPQVMDGLVSEIKSEEIADYLLDNPNVIVYIAPSNQKLVILLNPWCLDMRYRKTIRHQLH